jgi:hypothetical protein
MVLDRVLLALLRVTGVLQIVLGFAFWSGHLSRLLPVHWTIGVVFVLALWSIAVAAMIRRAHIGLAILAIAWGILLTAFGFTQQAFLPGDLHWVVRVLHLAVGLAALAIAMRLVRRDTAARGPAPELRRATAGN